MNETVDRIMLELEIGSRPAIVTSRNRNTVRRWCRGVGVASTIVEVLTLGELEGAYNDPEFLANLLSREAPPKARPAPDLPELAQQTAQAVAVLLAPLIAQAVAEALAAQPTPLDRKQIERIVSDKLSKTKL
jgi:hypothetical protein